MSKSHGGWLLILSLLVLPAEAYRQTTLEADEGGDSSHENCGLAHRDSKEQNSLGIASTSLLVLQAEAYRRTTLEADEGGDSSHENGGLAHRDSKEKHSLGKAGTSKWFKARAERVSKARASEMASKERARAETVSKERARAETVSKVRASEMASKVRASEGASKERASKAKASERAPKESATKADIDFDFDRATPESCPTGWKCKGDAQVLQCGTFKHDYGPLMSVHEQFAPRYSGLHCKGNYFCFTLKGGQSATSDNFVLPMGISKIKFWRAAGDAYDDVDLGLYVTSSDGTRLCSDEGRNSVFDFSVAYCDGLGQWEGTEAYIYVGGANRFGGYSHFWIDSIQFLDSSGAQLQPLAPKKASR